MHVSLRNVLPLVLAIAGLSAWAGCETHVTTDAPPPSRVDVQVEPGTVDVDVNRKPGGIDVDVERKPGGGVDVDIERKPASGVDVDVDVNKPKP